MNRKQDMVKELVERINASIALPEDLPLWAEKDFWEKYPDGHCDDFANPTVEGQLSCLTVESLERLMLNDCVSISTSWTDLWRHWGEQGYLKTAPYIMDNSRLHVLRLRHDSYLHLWRQNGFQNSYDAYGHGDNGQSAMDMQEAIRAITLSEYAKRYENDGESDAAWNAENRVFRKAMIMRYMFEACSKHQTFVRHLQSYPEVFDRFIAEVDARALELSLDKDLTLRTIKELCQKEEATGNQCLYLALTQRHHCDETVFAGLTLNTTSVCLRWVNGKEDCKYTINFPAWDCVAYQEEREDCGDNQMLSEKEYIAACWRGLSLFLLSLAGTRYSYEWFSHSSAQNTPAHMFPGLMLVGGSSELCRTIDDYCEQFRGEED